MEVETATLANYMFQCAESSHIFSFTAALTIYTSWKHATQPLSMFVLCHLTLAVSDAASYHSKLSEHMPMLSLVACTILLDYNILHSRYPPPNWGYLRITNQFEFFH